MKNNWIKVEIEEPKVRKVQTGYVSKYVSVKLLDGIIIKKCRLEGNTKDNLFWYPSSSDVYYTGDQIEDVIEWKKL